MGSFSWLNFASPLLYDKFLQVVGEFIYDIKKDWSLPSRRGVGRVGG